MLSTVPGHPVVVPLPGATALSLGCTMDGARLLVGTPAGSRCANFPHHRPTIRTALRAVTDHEAPDPGQACTGLTHP